MSQRPPVRFALVGLANTAVDLALFALLLGPLGLVVANIVSTSAGMTCSYVLNGRWTFRGSLDTRARAVVFAVITVTTMWVVQPVLILGILTTGTTIGLEVPDVVAKVGALAVTTILNYLGYRRFVWPSAQQPVAHG